MSTLPVFCCPRSLKIILMSVLSGAHCPSTQTMNEYPEDGMQLLECQGEGTWQCSQQLHAWTSHYSLCTGSKVDFKSVSTYTHGGVSLLSPLKKTSFNLLIALIHLLKNYWLPPPPLIPSINKNSIFFWRKHCGHIMSLLQYSLFYL